MHISGYNGRYPFYSPLAVLSAIYGQCSDKSGASEANTKHVKDVLTVFCDSGATVKIQDVRSFLQ